MSAVVEILRRKVPLRTTWLLLALLTLSCSSMLSKTPVEPIVNATASRSPAPLVTGDWTLVNFGADWCPACRQLKPELDVFRFEQPYVKLVLVDIDSRRSELYKTYYPKYFQGQSIPFTVAIDASGKAVKNWTGYVPYQNIVKDLISLKKAHGGTP